MNKLNVFNRSYLKGKYVFENIGIFFSSFKDAYQRITKGYCDRDICEFDWYLSTLIGSSLHQLADEADSIPYEYENLDAWKFQLNKIADLFESSIEENNVNAPAVDFNRIYENEAHISSEEQSMWIDKILKEQNRIRDLCIKRRKEGFKLLEEEYGNLWN